MKKFLRSTGLPALAMLFVLAFAPAAHGDPYVSTDRADYRAGETVVVTGSGWEPSETVVLTIREDPATHEPTVLNATADAGGRFVSDQFVVAADDQGVRFTLEAVGQNAGAFAMTTFTDPGLVLMAWSALPPGQSPNPVRPGETATFAVKVKVPVGQVFAVQLRILSGLPADAVAAFSPNPIVFSGNEVGTATLTIQTTAATPVGDLTVTFRAEKVGTPATDYADGVAFLSVRPLDLAIQPVIAVTGAAQDGLGYFVASAGDLNGDHQPDVVVGAPWHDNAAGQAFVFFGGPLADNVPDLSLHGTAPQRAFGNAVNSAGDMNGDGYDDLMVAEYAFGTQGNSPGYVHIYFGGPGLDATPDLTLVGPAPACEFGSRLAPAGDVNGDGYADVIVTAPSRMTPSGKGAAYVYFGGATPDANADLAYGPEGAYAFGSSAANIGDVNGDGLDDLAIGAHFSSRAWVYYGARPPNAVPDMALATSWENFGISISPAVDLTGDGHPDLVIGAQAWSSQRGRAYIYRGGPGFDGAADLILQGSTPGTSFGALTTRAGDVNGDGHDDLAVFSHVPALGTNFGAAHFFFGGPGLDATADLRLTGEWPAGAFAYVARPVGDFNADGWPDMIFSEYASHEGGQNAGKFHVFSFTPAQGSVLGAVTATCPDPGTGMENVALEARTGGPGGPLVQAALTGAGGSYALNGLAVGSYWIHAVAPEGFAVSANDLPVTVLAGGTVTADFTLLDTAPPVIVCPPPLERPTDPGLCTAVVAYEATAMDNCPGVMVAYAPPSGSIFPHGTTTVTATATDRSGNVSSCSFTVTVRNNPPVVAIVAPSSGGIFAAGEIVTFLGSFTDEVGDVHGATWTADAIAFAGSVEEASGTVMATQTFTTAGVYRVALTVTDQCGQQGSASTIDGLDALIVVYDPSAGFASGHGWILSPPGAYPAAPDLTGRAIFGFVSRYQRGARTPTGETEFMFRVADLNFHSSSYDWLVIAGARAQYKGSGTINGSGDYGFLLAAVDGDLLGTGTDLMRMKITDKASGTVIYDNQQGSGDYDDPTGAIGAGSIVVLSGGNGNGRGTALASRGDPEPAPGDDRAPLTYRLAAARPNPARTSVVLGFEQPEPGRVELVVFNVAGRIVRTLVAEDRAAGRHQVNWSLTDDHGRAVTAGVYFFRIRVQPLAGDAGFASTRRLLVIP